MQSILAMHRDKVKENMSLVNIEGQCPDDRLLEKGFTPALTKHTESHE